MDINQSKYDIWKTFVDKRVHSMNCINETPSFMSEGTSIKSQQGLLATYLILRCVGREIRLRSESLSSGAVRKSGNPEFSKSRNLEIQDCYAQNVGRFHGPLAIIANLFFGLLSLVAPVGSHC